MIYVILSYSWTAHTCLFESSGSTELRICDTLAFLQHLWISRRLIITWTGISIFAVNDASVFWSHCESLRFAFDKIVIGLIPTWSRVFIIVVLSSTSFGNADLRLWSLSSWTILSWRRCDLPSMVNFCSSWLAYTVSVGIEASSGIINGSWTGVINSGHFPDRFFEGSREWVFWWWLKVHLDCFWIILIYYLYSN